ncbi:DUF4173 domain-containing protein [Methylorubrum sp. SB2]|uniref:DUF4153 domain-containing protein n=1 Tax=Methylorubrum subtropicum TaxID=3138812 RepID=UPI00313E1381
MLASPTLSLALPSLRPARWLLLPALVVLGDRLFYGHAIGISLALFLAALAVTVPLANPVRRDARSLGLASILLVLGLLPLIEDAGFLAVLFGVSGLVAFAVIVTGGLAPGWAATLAAMRRMLLAGPLQIGFDAAAGLHRPVATVRGWRDASVVGWILPVILTGLFGALFASANPLIDAWLRDLPRLSLDPKIATGRLFAWGLLAALAWPFVAVRLRHRAPKMAITATPAPATPAPVALLGPAVIGRCLVLFNLLFAVQSGLDLLYLWGGLALPEGLTYAAYAHRGAYPLIATALLAAAFVLIAMGPCWAGERSGSIRRLVYLWIGQNVLLVVSAILRLDLYVAVYSLTLVRAAAFVWMGLVAIGLLLIVARIALRRSNRWLVAMNGIVLLVTLYGCALANFSAIVSSYNVAHSRELGGTGEPFDLRYAMQLGPEAIPAVDRFFPVAFGRDFDCPTKWRAAQVERAKEPADWRGWSFRRYRLERYLERRPFAPLTLHPMFKAPSIR